MRDLIGKELPDREQLLKAISRITSIKQMFDVEKGFNIACFYYKIY